MQPNSVVWRMLEFYGTHFTHRGKWRVHEFLRGALHATSDCDLEVKRQGLYWCLNPSDFVQTHLYWTGEYEAWDLFHLSQWIHPGAVVFDVGANFGYYSVRLAAKMYGKGQVYAFEPSRQTFSRLQRNISLNCLDSCIAAIPCGLSERRGIAYLDQLAGNSGATRISGQNNSEAIEVDTLDCFCEARQIRRIDIIKIDVEGSEVRVIEGGKATLSVHRPVMMVEFNSSALAEAGASIESLEDVLRGLGYELLMARRGQLVPLRPVSNKPAITNVFCIPEDRLGEIKSILKQGGRGSNLADPT